jgi:hypothetical protein
MIFSARASYFFVPKFNGNRELPESERMTFEIKRPKAEERGDLFSLDTEREIDAADVSGGSVKKAPVTFKHRYHYSRILRNHIGKITNMSAVSGDGKEIPISNGCALAESTAFGARDLITELCTEVLSDVLEEDEKKSSE